MNHTLIEMINNTTLKKIEKYYYHFNDVKIYMFTFVSFVKV